MIKVGDIICILCFFNGMMLDTSKYVPLSKLYIMLNLFISAFNPFYWFYLQLFDIPIQYTLLEICPVNVKEEFTALKRNNRRYTYTIIPHQVGLLLHTFFKATTRNF